MAKKTNTDPTATINISYTIAAKGRQPAIEANLTLTYDTVQTNEAARQGWYKITDISGTYSIGSVTIGKKTTQPVNATVEKLIGAHSIGNNNNRIYIGDSKQDANLPYLIDKHGISFLLKGVTAAHPGRVERVNLFVSRTKGLEEYARYTSRTIESYSINGVPVSTPSQQNNDAAVVATCFTTGTHILTARGEAAVEDLVVGDLALTASGATRPIRWIGHRDLDHVPAGATPVRIEAHAFGENLPARDLTLSPGHPVLVGADVNGEGGHLVPVMCLVNGTSVSRLPVDRVTYWHVELDAHDILLAEGLPAESYLDWGDRAFFTEGADHALMNPDFVVPGLAARCRPVALEGEVVEAARRRLDGIFAMRVAASGTWPSDEAGLPC